MEQKLRDLEAEAALQAERAQAAATALQMFEQQRTADLTILHDQHKEELAAAHS